MDLGEKDFTLSSKIFIHLQIRWLGPSAYMRFWPITSSTGELRTHYVTEATSREQPRDPSVATLDGMGATRPQGAGAFPPCVECVSLPAWTQKEIDHYVMATGIFESDGNLAEPFPRITADYFPVADVFAVRPSPMRFETLLRLARDSLEE